LQVHHKRNHLQVLAEILDRCREPQEETQVTCEINISIRLFSFCVDQLVKENMLEPRPKKKMYSTTVKGLRYLQILKEFNA